MEDKLSLSLINISYGDFILFKDFSLDFHYNSVNVILGPSGSGKTTLLNIMSVRLKDKSFVFQEPRLLEQCNAYDNINFVLRDKIKDKSKRDEVIKKYLSITGLIESSHLKPDELSGGMKQRLSLARALSYDAPFMLMDEPLQGQDIKMKKELLDIIIKSQSENPKTIFYVTHDVAEAIIVADNIFVLSQSPNTKIVYKTFIKQKERDLKSDFFKDLQATLIGYLLKL